MRRTISILLLCIYLCNATECNQLLKIPIFFAHVQEHMAEHRYASLWGFITEHYLMEQPHDADYERDMQLPFKSHEYLTYTNPVPPPPTQPQLTMVVQRQVTVIYPDYINKFHPLIYHPDIFQPPKA